MVILSVLYFPSLGLKKKAIAIFDANANANANAMFCLFVLIKR